MPQGAGHDPELAAERLAGAPGSPPGADEYRLDCMAVLAWLHCPELCTTTVSKLLRLLSVSLPHCRL